MTRHTEREIEVNQHIQLFKLKKLFHTKPNQFSEMLDFIPIFVSINNIDTLDLETVNSNVENGLGYSKEELITSGHAFIRKISDLSVLNHSTKKVEFFKKQNDKNAVCSYWQRMIVNGKTSLIYSHKIHLNSTSFLNVGHHMADFGKMGKVVSDIMNDFNFEQQGYERFRQLTKKERQILSLMAQGHTNKALGDILCSSPNTIRTHRNRIYKKLDILHFRDVVRFAQAFSMI